MEIVFIVGAIQSFFQVIILLNKKGKSLPDFILSTWLFFIGAHLVIHYLHTLGYSTSWPYLQGIEAPFPLIHGPLMLLYIQAQNGRTWKGEWMYLLHFVPFVALYFLYIPQFMYTADELSQWIMEVESGERVSMVLAVNVMLVFLSGPVYVIWSFIDLRRHKNLIGQFFSFQERINLKWLYILVVGMGIIWVAVIVENLWEDILSEAPVFILEGHLIFSVVTLFAFTIGYFGFKQGIIFTDRFEVEEYQQSSEKYQRSGLKKQQSETYADTLEELMVSEKPFLEPKLNLPQLSERIGIAQNHLSQVINEQFGKNFYEFVNEYRVAEFKTRIEKEETQHLTLLGMALECGFSSKSSFNEIFKKVEGTTPSQFVRSIK